MSDKITRKKEFGLYKIVTNINTIATNEGKITDKTIIKKRILATKEKIKRELISQRIHIDELIDPEEIDKMSVYKTLTMYLNPYYEYEVVKNLKAFPVDPDNKEALSWLDNFETYLAMHLLYYNEFGKVLETTENFFERYTHRELLEAKEILLDYYNLSNPKTIAIKADCNHLFYYPRKELIKRVEDDILNYELALLAKSLLESDNLDDIQKSTGFNKEKTIELLKKMSKAKQGKFSIRADLILDKEKIQG